MTVHSPNTRPLKIAIVGTGISGMASAWLLAKSHNVTVFEQNAYIGGHSNTVTANIGNDLVPVDTGFIVYNEQTYPNLTALFSNLNVPTMASEMSFSASLQNGNFEYSGTNLNGLIGQRRNIFRPRFWRMLRDIQRFYREAPAFLRNNSDNAYTLGAFLKNYNYSKSFINDHLIPMGAAIWSTTVTEMKNYPVNAFIRFFLSHGLLNITNRPLWRTVKGGSKEYVKRLTDSYKESIRFEKVSAIRRKVDGVEIQSYTNDVEIFDHVVIATHADEAFLLLEDPSPREKDLLSSWKYTRNQAVLHNDYNLMPKRKRVWSSWNFIANGKPDRDEKVCLTYWMNRLQNIPESKPLFVTLNPGEVIMDEAIISEHEYTHPYFDTNALESQKNLWDIQGINRTWFCGSYFGYGFHEDGLQSGLAVAEQLGGLSRPWNTVDENDRIIVKSPNQVAA